MCRLTSLSRRLLQLPAHEFGDQHLVVEGAGDDGRGVVVHMGQEAFDACDHESSTLLLIEVEVAQRDGQRVGDVGRFGRRGQGQFAADRLLDLRFRWPGRCRSAVV